MSWEDVSEERIWELLNEDSERMNAQDRRFWEAISIHPELWKEAWNAVWAVAIFGRNVIWYDGYERGFRVDRYTVYGTIDKHGSIEQNLDKCIDMLRNLIRDEHRFGPDDYTEFHR